MKTKNEYKFLILGSGLAGLGVAITLKLAGEDYLIIEKEDTPGGLNRNMVVGGCDFDFGPKILLLDDSENSQEILSFLGKNYERYPVVERTYLSQYGLLGFPLQRYLVDLPGKEQKKILVDLKLAKKFPRKIKSFEDWLINGFGKYFCELILFPYEEKKWQASLREMDYKWALNRPIKVNYNELIKGSKRRLPPKNYYYYPKKGNISVLSRAIAKRVSNIMLNNEVLAINLKGKYVDTTQGRFYYQFLISSLPLDMLTQVTNNLPDNLKKKSQENLKRLSIFIFNLVFAGRHQVEGTAIYFPERKFIFRRVSVLQNLCPALGRKNLTPISVELSINQNNNSSNQEKLLNRILSDFAKIPMLKDLGRPVNWKMLRIDFAYPLQTGGLSKVVKEIHSFYSRFGVYHCGRGGNFDYCNSDQAYKQGREIAQQVLQNINDKSN